MDFKVYHQKISRIMNLTALLLLVLCLQVNARGFSQNITISVKEAPLEKVMAEIEKQSGYSFIYGKALISQADKVTLSVTNQPLQQVLDLLFSHQRLNYRISDNFIVLSPKPTAALQSADSSHLPPPIEIHGCITDSTGTPLAGASVRVKGTKKGTSTDANGNFILKDVPTNAVLNISYTGYVSKEITIGEKTDITVSLIRSTSPLDAVQVIPYGTTTQRLSTGNISTVTSKEIEIQPVSNVLEALEGRVPGLLITQTTGLPGGAINVQIRGQNSIANGNNPFYVIDGVPYISQLPYTQGTLINYGLDGGNPLDFINPYDIESVEVLKDADATAIYGSRAANGAILITTKKGKAGIMKFDVNLKSGITTPARTIQVMNTTQYLQMRREAFKNDGVSPIPSYAYDINGTWDTTRYTNWPKQLTSRDAEYTDAEASVSGGTSNIQYLIGGGYLVQKTGFPSLMSGNGGSRQGSIHFNIDGSSTNKRFKISLTGSFNANKNTVQSYDFTSASVNLPPDAPPIFNPDGSLNWAPLAPGETGTWTNIYSHLYNRYSSNTSNLLSNLGMSYSIIRGLEARVSLGYTNMQTNEVSTTPTTYYDPGYHTSSGTSFFNAINSHSWIVEPQIEYKLRLGKGTFDLLAGSTFQQANTNIVNTYATGFVSDALLQDIQAAPASDIFLQTSATQENYEAVFGRLTYNWEDKFVLDLNARTDGTSRFGPGKQFGNFSSIGAAWIFTKENFVKNNLRFLSFGKLRASYGTTGNSQVADYQFIDTYQPTLWSYGNFQGLTPVNLANPLLAWETTKKLEGAIELGFFQDRIMLQASFYRNRSGNELVQTPVSQVTGFQYISSNLPALVQNTGKEISLNTINIKSKNFKWTSNFNLTIARNKLVAYPGLSSSPYANTLVVGQSLGIKKLFHEIGVNDTTGLYEFASSKGPSYSPAAYTTDMDRLIDLTPKFYGGLSNSFSYKNFSLSFFFQFVKQTGLRFWASYPFLPGMEHNQPTYILNESWRNPGDHKPYQQFTQSYGSEAANTANYAQFSDFAYGDASYIRLKNVAASWQIPRSLENKNGLSCRLYLQFQNLWTITKYDGMDPETQKPATGPRRGIVAGIQLGW